MRVNSELLRPMDLRMTVNGERITVLINGETNSERNQATSRAPHGPSKPSTCGAITLGLESLNRSDGKC